MGRDDKKEYPNIIVFDLETGGFSPVKNPIIEIAVLCINNKMEEVGRKEWVVLPYIEEKEYTPGAFSANGFTMSEIEKRGTDSKTVVEELIKFLEESKINPKPFTSYVPDRKPVMSGHNIDKFDLPFLDQFFKEHKQDLYKYISKKSSLDTMKMAQLFFGHPGYTYNNHQLGTCCQYIGRPIVNAHKAMNDVEGNTQLLKYFIESTRGERESIGSTEMRERDTFKLS